MLTIMFALCLAAPDAAPPPAAKRKVLVLPAVSGDEQQSESARLLSPLVASEFSRQPNVELVTLPVDAPTSACGDATCAAVRAQAAGADEVVVLRLELVDGVSAVHATRYTRQGLALAASTQSVGEPSETAFINAARQAATGLLAEPPWAVTGAASRANWFPDLTLRKLAMVVVGGGFLVASFVAMCVAIAGTAISIGGALNAGLQTWLILNTPATQGEMGVRIDPRREAAYSAGGIMTGAAAFVGFALLGIFATVVGVGAAVLFTSSVRE